MKKIGPDTLIIGGVGVITIIIIIFIAIVATKEGSTDKSSAPSYTATDSQRPTVKTDSNFQDLGKMKVSDEKTATFTITNNGSKPLILSKINSSCDCTFGKVTINDTSSPELGMHSRSTWQGTLEPGKQAKVEVIYRPSIMPVKGEVGRDVYITTNDPEKPMLTFSVKAFVE